MTEDHDERKARSKMASIESVNQLIRRIYTGGFKRRKTLKDAEISAMRSAPEMSESERDDLLILALSDRTLDRTLQLMLLGVQEGALTITNQMRDFAGEVLRRHPAFRTNFLPDVSESLSNTPSEDEEIQVLTSHDYSSFSWPETEPMKKGESERCKVNAVCCLLLWFRATRGMSLERFRRHLQKNLWKPAARLYETEAEKLRVLVSAKDSSAASIACALMEEWALEQSRRAYTAVQAEERAVSRARELDGRLIEVRAKLAASRTEIDRLEREFTQERQTYANERAHLKDGYERLRGQVLRRLRDELLLLDEGLHALRREPPKVHVMVDHAERAIDGLKREMERLAESS